MLSHEQEIWLSHLSADKKIKILPLDSSAEEKFEQIKSLIQERLGSKINVEHRGATSLGISGQDEIDLYIPVPPSQFDLMVEPLKAIFGDPRSYHPMDRVRFSTKVDDKRIDLFLINNECQSWLRGLRFEEYLRTHPEALQAYRLLKESGDGLSVQEYYRRKIEFINDILGD